MNFRTRTINYKLPSHQRPHDKIILRDDYGNVYGELWTQEATSWGDFEDNVGLATYLMYVGKKKIYFRVFDALQAVPLISVLKDERTWLNI